MAHCDSGLGALWEVGPWMVFFPMKWPNGPRDSGLGFFWEVGVPARHSLDGIFPHGVTDSGLGGLCEVGVPGWYFSLHHS